MSENSHRQTRLSQPDTALANYLDTLLAEIDQQQDLPAAQAVKEQTPQADMSLEKRDQREPTVTVAERVEDEPAALAASRVPQWAEHPFQVLRFRVNGANLVVPLQSLTGIISLRGPISHLPGQPAWSLGVVMNRDTKVVVVDTGKLLMPDGDGVERSRYSHLLLIGDGDRGLAVDALNDTATIDKESIRWPGEAIGQPWFGGILVEELSVLLDVEGVMEALAA